MTTRPRDLLHELPLPVAALLWRARDAKEAKEAHDVAYFAWEASVRLAVATNPPADLARLAVPSAGDWVRALTAPELVLDAPELHAVLAHLTEVGAGRATRTARLSVRQLVDALPAYRNKVIGHVSVRAREFYPKASATLVEGLAAAWRAGAFVPAGSRLVHVDSLELERDGSRRGRVLDLTGIRSRVEDRRETGSLPDEVLPGRCYLRTGDRWRCLHPFIAYHEKDLRERVLFFNGARRTAEYLDYVTGEVLRGPALEAVLPDLGRTMADLVRSEGPHAAPPRAAATPAGARVARGNVPAPLTSFVGRVAAASEVRDLLLATRCVTLVGPGGCGKTRLALDVARSLSAVMEDGAWVADFASVSAETLVPQVLATALRLEEEPGRTFLDVLGRHLAERHALLVLDNCEHLRDACAALAQSLLAASPGSVVLATSREPLGIPGETAWPVPSLEVPDPEDLPPVERLADLESVRLFVERAKAVRRSFALTEDNARAVARTCRFLDGIPLAIELAAARVKILSPQQVEERLHDCFRLLTGGDRGALPRQRTLRAAIDWSHDQLDAAEKTLYRRLAIFVGTFSVDAVEATCAGEGLDEGDVLDVLGRLADKSLIQVTEHGGTARYGMLQTIRQHALERLDASGERAALAARHRAFFAGLVAALDAGRAAGDAAAYLTRLDAEHDNVRAALGAPSATDDEAVTMLRMATMLRYYWEVRGHWTEGRLCLAAALDGARTRAGSPLLASVMEAMGALAFRQGDLDAASPLLLEGLALAREGGDRRVEADAANVLGCVAWARGDLGGARSRFEEVLALHRASGLRPRLAQALNNLGAVAAAQGDLDAARSLYEESLALKRALNDERGIAATLNNLGSVKRALGEVEEALEMFEASLERWRRLGDPLGVAECLGNLGRSVRELGDAARARLLHEESLDGFRRLDDRGGVLAELENFAALLAAEDRPEDGARLLGAAEALRERAGLPLVEATQRRDLETLITRLRSVLGETAFEAGRSEGRALSLDDAVSLATSEGA